MLRHSPIRFWVLVLVSFTWLGVNLGSPHLHLCFDGLEPSSSLHGFDGAVHHAKTALDGAHEDVDIDLARDTVAKTVKLDLGVFVAAIAIVFVVLGLLSRQPPPLYRPAFLLSSLSLLRPPVRGPPLPISP